MDQPRLQQAVKERIIWTFTLAQNLFQRFPQLRLVAQQPDRAPQVIAKWTLFGGDALHQLWPVELLGHQGVERFMG